MFWRATLNSAKDIKGKILAVCTGLELGTWAYIILSSLLKMWTFILQYWGVVVLWHYSKVYIFHGHISLFLYPFQIILYPSQISLLPQISKLNLFYVTKINKCLKPKVNVLTLILYLQTVFSETNLTSLDSYNWMPRKKYSCIE